MGAIASRRGSVPEAIGEGWEWSRGLVGRLRERGGGWGRFWAVRVSRRRGRREGLQATAKRAPGSEDLAPEGGDVGVQVGEAEVGEEEV